MIITNEELLDYFRAKKFCELCARRIRYTEQAHPHHVQARGHGGGSRLDVALNVVSACWLCHGEADTPEQKDRCLEIIAYREGLLPDQVQEAHLEIVTQTKDGDNRQLKMGRGDATARPAAATERVTAMADSIHIRVVTGPAFDPFVDDNPPPGWIPLDHECPHTTSDLMERIRREVPTTLHWSVEIKRDHYPSTEGGRDVTQWRVYCAHWHQIDGKHAMLWNDQVDGDCPAEAYKKYRAKLTPHFGPVVTPEERREVISLSESEAALRNGH
ncbi:MAG TPA: HNH endonuclease [Gemmataceae bacterium]|nr:HNH endonuclease [Gemmataceae bacterium]